jgi:cyclophilin family peptidyl-prolyl cis-trans isomerase
MRRTPFVVVLSVTLALAGLTGPAAGQSPPAPAAPVIVLDTDKGVIEITTFPADAPKAVAHVLALVRSGFYRGLRFHWVQPGVIQAGDPMTRRMTKINEWGTGGSGKRIGVAEISKRPFVRGMVGLYYQSGWKPEDSDSQFFILKLNNPALDGKYIAIGRVTKGMEVADRIAKTDLLKIVYVKGEVPR